jgi:hypothetical protein
MNFGECDFLCSVCCSFSDFICIVNLQGKTLMTDWTLNILLTELNVAKIIRETIMLSVQRLFGNVYNFKALLLS